MSDAILLEGLRFFGYHGLYPEERTLGQRFLVDVVAELDLRNAGQHDELDETVNYNSMYNIVRSVVEGEPMMLVEAVADRTARLILEAFPPVTAVEVTVRKPEATIRGAHLDAIGVRVRRVRAHVDATQPASPPKPPFLRPKSLRKLRVRQSSRIRRWRGHVASLFDYWLQGLLVDLGDQ